MNVAEHGDELRNRIIGHHLAQQRRLMRPANSPFLGSQLHPYSIYAVLRYHANIGDHQQMAALYGKGIYGHLIDILLGLLGYQQQGIMFHHEIILISVMVSGREINGVYLPLVVCDQYVGMSLATFAVT